MNDDVSMLTGAAAFSRHSSDVEFFRALAAIAELGATRELAIDELVQRFGSHRKCAVHLFALSLEATRLMEAWMSTLFTDASQKGIDLHAVSEADASAALQGRQTLANQPLPGAQP